MSFFCSAFLVTNRHEWRSLNARPSYERPARVSVGVFRMSTLQIGDVGTIAYNSQSQFAVAVSGCYKYYQYDYIIMQIEYLI